MPAPIQVVALSAIGRCIWGISQVLNHSLCDSVHAYGTWNRLDMCLCLSECMRVCLCMYVFMCMIVCVYLCVCALGGAERSCSNFTVQELCACPTFRLLIMYRHLGHSSCVCVSVVCSLFAVNVRVCVFIQYSCEAEYERGFWYSMCRRRMHLRTPWPETTLCMCACVISHACIYLLLKKKTCTISLLMQTFDVQRLQWPWCARIDFISLSFDFQNYSNQSN